MVYLRRGQRVRRVVRVGVFSVLLILSLGALQATGSTARAGANGLGYIHGTVTDGGGTPLPGIQIGVLDPLLPPNEYAVVAEGVTDAAGAYGVWVPPGEWYVVFVDHTDHYLVHCRLPRLYASVHQDYLELWHRSTLKSLRSHLPIRRENRLMPH